jgi:hypothetical protein
MVRFVRRFAHRAEQRSAARAAEREENDHDACKFNEAREAAPAEIGPAHDPERTGRQDCQGGGRSDERRPFRCLRPVPEDQELSLAHDRTPLPRLPPAARRARRTRSARSTATSRPRACSKSGSTRRSGVRGSCSRVSGDQTPADGRHTLRTGRASWFLAPAATAASRGARPLGSARNTRCTCDVRQEQRAAPGETSGVRPRAGDVARPSRIRLHEACGPTIDVVHQPPSKRKMLQLFVPAVLHHGTGLAQPACFALSATLKARPKRRELIRDLCRKGEWSVREEHVGAT